MTTDARIPDPLAPLRVDAARLRHYPRNPRRGDVDAIKASLNAHGQYRPIVVNARTQEVLAGNHTLRAARELGWSEIAATYVDVDEEQAARIALIDNRANDLATYDERELADLLDSLPTLDATGYEPNDLQRLLRSLTEAPDMAPGARPEHPQTKSGDLVELPPHRLLCGDSASGDDIARLMGDDLARMVLADPPYNVDYKGGTNWRGTAVVRQREDAYPDQRDDYGQWLAAALESGADASDDCAALHLWHASSQHRAIYAALAASGWRERTLIIWDKGSIKGGLRQATKQYRNRFEPMLYCHKTGKTPRWYGPGNESTVWEEGHRTANPLHPTMKPVSLYERSLLNHTKVGDVVLELFGGSGSTLIAAENLGRRAFLMEIDPGYCDVIRDRYEQHTAAERTMTGA